MRDLLGLSPWFLAAGLALGACGNTTGDSGSGGVGGTGGAGVTPISASLVDRMCEVYQPCCRAEGYENEPTLCKSLFADVLVADEAAAEACVAAIEKQATASDWCDTWYTDAYETPSACDAAFVVPESQDGTGTSKVGEPCEYDSDCAKDPRGTTACSFGSGDPEMCEVLIDQQEGEPCMGARSSNGYSYSPVDGVHEILLCENGLTCSNGECLKPRPLGGSCQQDQDCADQQANYCGEGECRPRIALGQSCREAPFSCENGLYCDVLTVLCLRLGGGGAACQTGMECESHACSGGVCEAPDPGGSDGAFDDGGFSTWLVCTTTEDGAASDAATSSAP